VVVHDVHNHADAGVVERVDHLLEFVDPRVRIVRIAGKPAFRNIVLVGIVSPVVQFVGRVFVNAGKIINWHDLYVRHAQLFQIIDARGISALRLQARFGER